MPGRRPLQARGFPPVKPRWLGPAATVAVVLAHVGVAVLLMVTAIEKYVPLESVSMDLIPEGGHVRIPKRSRLRTTRRRPKRFEQTRPRYSPSHAHDSGRARHCRRRRKSFEPKKHVVERKEVTAPAKEHREAQEHHRLGMAGGRAQSGGVSRAALWRDAGGRDPPPCAELLVAWRKGSASCSFHVTGGGGMTGISCSGSSSAHASLLQRAIASTHAPPPPGGGFFASQGVPLPLKGRRRWQCVRCLIAFRRLDSKREGGLDIFRAAFARKS